MRYKNFILFSVIASFFLLCASPQTMTGAGGTIVKLRVPGLPSGDGGDPQDRIRFILAGIEGILHYSLDVRSLMVKVTFDETKTSVDNIIEKLSRGGCPVSGKPQWVK